MFTLQFYNFDLESGYGEVKALQTYTALSQVLAICLCTLTHIRAEYFWSLRETVTLNTTYGSEQPTDYGSLTVGAYSVLGQQYQM